MNWKLLGTMVTLIGVGASVALGQGTTPTIVQGDYISNVFGNSNFIKNPNAKLNATSGVTVSSATVSRSPTTPLVATSEFNVAITSANGTVTWDTRAFDAGMKGQNCEARFTYRGFASTSKVHIKQGANTVASLNLTASTDPRIASINFPCGDLSAATTFVVTDTAILSGSPTPNEIGGIYVGLATNMANVAQAEVVVRATRTTAQSIPNNTATAIVYNSTALDVLGEFNTSTGIYTAKRAGRYLIDAFFMYDSASWTAGNIANISIWKNSGQVHEIYNTVQTTGTLYVSSQINYTVELAVGDTIYIATYQTSGAARNLIANSTYHGLSISRFPSSSELVVTPERQNVWAGVVYTNQAQSLFGGTAEPSALSSFNNAVWNQPTLLKGKAAVTTTNSGNDLGFSVANLPVGNYKVDITGLLNATTAGSTTAGALARCTFKLVETTTSTDVARQVHIDNSYSTASDDETRNYVNAFTGVFNNTSVGTRNFRIEAQKTNDSTPSNIGTCQAYSNTAVNDNNSNIAIILTPLDQPSNSALYVEGPVKAAATGAAIPAGYVGERITPTGAITDQVVTTSVADWTNMSITLNPGVYALVANINAQVNAGATAGNDTECNFRLTDSANNIVNNQHRSVRIKSTAASSALFTSTTNLSTVVNVTTASTIYKIRLLRQDNNGTGGCTAYNQPANYSDFYAIRLN